ncbi:conserved membrane hypothetical protein [Planktothrix serta PCC 8927]|uniref:Glycosyltransferase RgtA/B/C/D-like domain-containing protein n=1 Tax=Planktothrix serta PCC 8927 TaxID=671068 RepID=A0A7Z9BQL1_9CYAN|nr:glycosyltransferase family 39 protein [Planktothrix serta]VXD17647.1 conserved membrane hypothetical protein [Planktothrix serta PCC 8927]
MKHKKPPAELIGVSLIWLLVAVSDRLWFRMDDSVPAWDHADYLNSALDYWRVWQQPQWFSGDWWSQMWMLSPKVPPLTYLLTIPFQNVLGIGLDQTNAVHLLFSAILFASVYGLGTQLFNRSVGFWATVLSALLPGLYHHRLQFLLDYPLTAMVTLSFYCLTLWWFSRSDQSWGLSILFGLTFGLALLTKQTTLFFLFTPLLWVTVAILKHRQWQRFLQLAIALLLSITVIFPWARTNWLLMLTSGKRATIDSAIAEGDPALTSLDAWTYYFKLLPAHVSWPLLIIPIIGLLYYIIKHYSLSGNQQHHPFSNFPKLELNWISLKWLTVFWFGGYFISSLNINKDFRYTLPLLPVLAIVLAYFLTLFPQRWGRQIRWGTVSLGIILMIFNLWPIGSYPVRQVMRTLNPGNQHHVYLGNPWPNEQVIAEIIQSQPYLKANLGVLPSTPEINQHNFNYYGSLQDSQVYARQVGTKEKNVLQDVRSLSWFVTKSGQQGSVDRVQDAQQMTMQMLENSPEFKLKKQWLLPDNSFLNLYQRITPFVQVEPFPPGVKKVELGNLLIPNQAPPGVPVPVTYDWRGSLPELQEGVVILTWRLTSPKKEGLSFWIHDHGMGMGQLYANSSDQSYQVIERMAMLPPVNIIPGNYRLEATYLNRKTGESYKIETPNITLKIDPKAPPLAAPELDLVTQLRTLSVNLPQGIKGLDPIFAEVGRINQYDPTQDYTIQAETALEYRLKQEPFRLDLAYNLGLANVLQQDAKGAIAALKQVTQLDNKNPNAHAYLAFVYLYNLQPKLAEQALKPALELNPNQPEFKALLGVSQLMQGNIIPAWQNLQALK